MTELDVPGPIDFILIEFPGDAQVDGVAAALLDLIDRGVVRLYDLAALRKELDGSFESVEITDASVGALSSFAGARSGLLSDEDLAEAAAAMEPGTKAALLVFENSWAVPFVKATIEAGGELVASQRLSVQEILDTLDAVDAAS